MDTSIFTKCMLLVLEQHSAGGDRKISKSKLEVKKDATESDPEAKSWNATKKIFGMSLEYKAIATCDGRIKAELDKMEVPAQFQRGTYAIPTVSVPKAQELVNAYLAERAQLVKAFVDAYPTIVGQQEVALGPLFDISDYPPPDAIASRFRVNYKWLALGVPEQLAEVSQDLYDQQVMQQSLALQETMNEVRNGLRSAFKGLIDHLLNRLSQKDDKGNVKRLHTSAVTNIVEFLDMLPAKNITNDAEITALAEKAKSIVNATDVESLKTDEDSRFFVEKRLTSIAAALDGLIESAPVRKMGGFQMDDEEESAA